MSTRTSSRSVTFRRPFLLSGFEAIQAAGTYMIDTVEEAIESITLLAYRRVSTQMQVPAHGAIESRSVDPGELDEALLRDASQQEPLDRPASPVPHNATREATRGALMARLIRPR